MADLTTVAFIVKKLYSKKEPENLATRDRVFLSMVPKEDGFYGSNWTVAVKHANPQGTSSTFATAQANAGLATKGIAWTVTRAKKYSFATIDGESMLATQNNMGAFVSMATQEIDGAIDEHGHQLAIALYGDGSEAIGQVGVGTASPITLATIDDAKNFSVGQIITANPTKTGTVGNMRAGTGTISAINEDTGVLTYTGTITSLAVSDWLYSQGNYDGGTNGKLLGLAAHFPLTAPTGGDSFYGVDRSVNANRLAGWRVTNTSLSIEEGFLTAATSVNKGGGRKLTGLTNPTNWSNLSKALGSKVQRDAGGTATFGFDALEMDTAAGRVRIYSDPECPIDRSYLLQMSSLKFKYLGPGVPHIIKDDGNEKLRQASADGVELRVRSMGNLVCDAPVRNAVIQHA